MPYARISGWGMYVPSNVVTNENLVEKGLDTSDEWITSRTGIKERRLIDQNEATSDLAVKAARRALGLADLHPGDIDLILIATCTPDHSIPATASIVQDKLGGFPCWGHGCKRRMQRLRLCVNCCRRSDRVWTQPTRAGSGSRSAFNRR